MKGQTGKSGTTQRDSKTERTTRAVETTNTQPAAGAMQAPLDAFVQLMGNRRLNGLLAADRSRPDTHEAQAERFAREFAERGAFEPAASAVATSVPAAREGPSSPPAASPRNAGSPVSRGALERSASSSLPTPPRAQLVSQWLGEGRSIEPRTASAFGPYLGIDLGAVRIHDTPQAHRLARALHAAAFTIGRDIVFGATRYDPQSTRGRHLLAHELNHVAQQTLRRVTQHALAPVASIMDPSGRTALQRVPDDPVAASDPAAADEEFDIYEGLPDDKTLEAGVDSDFQAINERWWLDLELMEVWPFRDYDPHSQPKAYANRVVRAQRLFREAGTKWFEGGHLKADGILGPRTFLMLHRIASDAKHPLRLQIQGLGFDLDAILDAEDAYLHALANARKSEILLQTTVEVYGESAVRFYDKFYSMVTSDREVFDRLLFDGAAPSDMRREDRIELLHRFYGADSVKYRGTMALLEAERDFLHTELDIKRAIENDKRRGNAYAAYFRFSATSARMFAEMDGEFAAVRAFEKAYQSAPEDKKTEITEGVDRLVQNQPDGPELGAKEISAVVLVVYLPPLDPSKRDAVIAGYVKERDAKRAEEKARIEENNREGAKQRADIIVKWLDDEDTHKAIVESALVQELKRAVREQAFFDLVLDDLTARPGGYFDKLFDAAHAMDGYGALSLLVEAARAGHYRDHARVRRAQEELIRRHGKQRTHRYEINAKGGAVFLDRDTRMEVGEVAGDHDTMFLKDEDREQLKPAARKKLEAELENQSRLYVSRLLEGKETPKSQEAVGKELLEKAWAAAGLDTDSDIEDVEWQESVRLLGVREGPDQGDGVTRYEVKYERVERILGGEGGDTEWAPVAGARSDWRSEYDFEYDTFWYPYSQNADVMEGFAKVVLIGAVIAVAWEAGVIAALVSAGGGAIPVALSIGISMAIYMLTHKRWTLEGLLMAGVEGYLASVGFRLFAPAGKVVARLVIPATLEKVTFGRLVAAWVLKHGAVGGLTGGAMGPSVLFMHDLIRIAQHGGGLSPFSAYLKSAGMGMVLGAVFEIGGSALLAPIFRAADTTVLAKMSDILTALRGHEPAVTPTQWMSEVTLSLSAFRKFLGQNMDEILAKGVYEGVKEKMAEAGRAWLTGVRGTLQQQVIELAGVQLSRDASNGLERLLTLGRSSLGDDTLATMLQEFRKVRPDGIEPWLRFLGGVDEAMAKNLVTSSQLRPMFDAQHVLALGLRRSPAELMNLMTLRFGNALDALDAYAGKLGALKESTADTILEALRTRGTAVTPRSLLTAGEAGAIIDDELLQGLGRLLEKSTPDAANALDTVLEKMARNRIDGFLRGMRNADQAEVDAVKKLVTTHKPEHAAWGLDTLSGQEATKLLGSLSDAARDAIGDITAKEAQVLVGALTEAHVNTALSQGVGTGTLRGSDLMTMRAHWHDVAIRDYMRWAGSAPNRIAALKNTAGAIASGSARLKPATALGADSLIIDSNALFGIEALMRGTPFKNVTLADGSIVQGLPEHRQEAINALRKREGLGEYVDPVDGKTPKLKDIVGDKADLRANDTIASETVVGEPKVGRSPVLDDLRSVGDARKHADYEKVYDDLKTADVGEDKGARDRTVVADALLAPRAPGVVPTLIVVDRPVVLALAKNFAPAPRVVTTTKKLAWGELNAHYPKGEFVIDVHGHQLRIVFKPSPP